MTATTIEVERRFVQRRTLWILGAGQVLGGLAVGAAFSLGSLLMKSVSGSDELAGMSATMSTLGAAIFAFPLAWLAARRGRRFALTSGALLALLGSLGVILSASIQSFPLLLVSVFAIGANITVNLQSRFAATDLSTGTTRARDLSLVVWATTIGIVVGPNLAGPGDALGSALGMPLYTGAFLISAVAQILVVLIFLTALRPDPLLTARRLENRPQSDVRERRGLGAAFVVMRRHPQAALAVASLAMSHAVMVAVMSMTPVHMEMNMVVVVWIGFTVSLHTAGMYLFSPVFGWLADRWGRTTVILIGQVVLAVSLLINVIWPFDMTNTMMSLVLLGLGWSMATVSASAWLTESVKSDDRPTAQGFSDTMQSLAGAAGGGLAGLVLGLIGYAGLNALMLVLPVVLTVLVAASVRRGRGVPTA